MSLKEELAEFRSGWFMRVPVERQAIMARHIAELRNGLANCTVHDVGLDAIHVLDMAVILTQDRVPSRLGTSGPS
jgi:hypothetical protein